MKNASDDVIDDVINTNNYRIVTHVRQNFLNKFVSRRLAIGRSIMKNTSDDIINEVINT